MQVIVPRLVGILALVWAVTMFPGVRRYEVIWAWAAYSTLWLTTSVGLVAVRWVRWNGAMLAGLAVLGMLWPQPERLVALDLLAWFGVLIAVTEGRPAERALLLRVMVTVIYVSTAAAKLNPSFLAGEQMAWIAASRSHMAPLAGVMASWVGVALSVGTIVGELAIATALWFRRTRVAAAIVGAAMHGAFVFVVGSGDPGGLALLFVLNGGLVLGYLAFFRRLEGTESSRESGAMLGSLGRRLVDWAAR